MVEHSHREQETNGKRVAVIGSGFGGLSAAIRLQSAGYECVLFEARDKAGGRAYVYEKDGFAFDGGPTVITAPHCIEELFTISGRRITRETGTALTPANAATSLSVARAHGFAMASRLRLGSSRSCRTSSGTT